MKRRTAQKDAVRRAVFEMLDHPTACDIYTFVRIDHPRISMGTVYRILGDLANSGEIIKLEMPDGSDRYDKTGSSHYHIICRICGKFADIDLPYDDGIDRRAEELSGFESVSHRLLFRGLCRECAKNPKAKN